LDISHSLPWRLIDRFASRAYGGGMRDRTAIGGRRLPQRPDQAV